MYDAICDLSHLDVSNSSLLLLMHLFQSLTPLFSHFLFNRGSSTSREFSSSRELFFNSSSDLAPSTSQKWSSGTLDYLQNAFSGYRRRTVIVIFSKTFLGSDILVFLNLFCLSLCLLRAQHLEKDFCEAISSAPNVELWAMTAKTASWSLPVMNS